MIFFKLLKKQTKNLKNKSYLFYPVHIQQFLYNLTINLEVNY